MRCTSSAYVQATRVAACTFKRTLRCTCHYNIHNYLSNKFLWQHVNFWSVCCVVQVQVQQLRMIRRPVKNTTIINAELPVKLSAGNTLQLFALPYLSL